MAMPAMTRIYGGTGNDTVYGGTGNDTISAGDGNNYHRRRGRQRLHHLGHGRMTRSPGGWAMTLSTPGLARTTSVVAMAMTISTSTLPLTSVIGGVGYDQVYLTGSTGNTIDLATTGIEWISGGDGSDTLMARQPNRGAEHRRQPGR